MTNEQKEEFKKAYEGTFDEFSNYCTKHEYTVEDLMDIIEEVYGQKYLQELFDNR
jgi:hypothetical protein